MILGIVTLLTAFCISGIAAYYSIVGLTAIFAGAFLPIVLMGSTLELGKVVTTLWLHYNWERAPLKIKSYLVSAVCVIMFITSMGIFGFLSRAHLDQAVPTGDIQAQVSLIDEKIKTQRDNIESDRKALSQMDATVDQVLGRSTTEQGALKSSYLRQSQKKERTKLQNDIDISQKEITKLQEERAPIASQARKVEAEVGPIKYIAAMIYGDHPDQNLLERAVRWVIIVIVFVFDPLAIVLILAATTSLDWAREKRAKSKDDPSKVSELQSEIERLRKITQDDALQYVKSETEYERQLLEMAEKASKLQQEQTQKNLDIERLSAILSETNSQLTELLALYNNMEEDLSSAIGNRNTLEESFQHIVREYDDLLEYKNSIELELNTAKEDLKVLSEIAEFVQKLQQEKELSLNEIDRLTAENSELKDKVHLLETSVVPVANVGPIAETIEPIVIALPTEQILTSSENPTVLATETVSDLNAQSASKKDSLPKLGVDIDNFPLGGNASFGTSFPANPLKGDIFLRVDMMPTKLFKWSGTRWIEVDKSVTDSMSYNEEYIKLLVSRIETGEIDIDDLNSLEQSQIEAYLKKQDNNG